MGDPQAPFEKVLALLDGHGLLGDHGTLREEVVLVSLGDHYDWGGADRRAEAADDAEDLVRWLAHHPPDQVILILGNHDLTRVSELGGYDDAGFEAALAEAREAYRDGDPDPEREARFLDRHPAFPSAEMAARDLASFRESSRAQVVELARQDRWRVGWAAGPDLLVTHAGIGRGDLEVLGVRPDAGAAALAAALDEAVLPALRAWEPGTRFEVPGLHRPAGREHGAGAGIFYQHAAHPSSIEDPGAQPRRRFDARELPRDLTQVVGHVRDGRCRSLLGPWVADPGERDGVIRHLLAAGEDVVYRQGAPPPARPGEGRVVFVDPRLSVAPVEECQLLDLDTLAPLPRRD